MIDSIGSFGDPRRAERGASIFERIVATGSVVLRRIGGDRAGEMATRRFLNSTAVTVNEIVATLGTATGERCRGGRIVVPQDTSEINFGHRDNKHRRLGRGGDGVGPGFFIHAAIAVDADEDAVVGLVDAQIWTRSRLKDDQAACDQRRKRSYDKKESLRWLTAAKAAAERLTAARQIIVVGDRESDIYPLFVGRPANTDFIIRASQDRAVEGGDRLFSLAAGWPELTRYQLNVPARKIGEVARQATIAIRADRVHIKRPRNGYDKNDPPSIELTLVEAQEIDPPKDVEPIHWRLLTTMVVAGAADATEIVRLYRLRWRIEQTFRALKRDGLELPETQVQRPRALFNLAAIALAAAVRTIQLVDARDGGSRPATDVIEPQLIKVAAAIGRTLERATERQKNPHPQGSLAWLSWIIARLGGWNCYYKPPGPKTMRQGWDEFAAMAAGYLLAISGD